MNPLSALFEIFKGHLHLDQDAYISVQDSFNEKYNTSDSGFLFQMRTFFEKNPWIIFIIPFTVPLLKRQVDAFFERYVGDTDDDGDIDIEDAIMNLLERRKAKKLGNG